MRHREESTQAHLAHLRARDQLVKSRTLLINHVRGAVRSVGHGLPASSAEAFSRRAAAHLPTDRAPARTPLVGLIATLTTESRAYDHALAELAATTYTES